MVSLIRNAFLCLDVKQRDEHHLDFLAVGAQFPLSQSGNLILILQFRIDPDHIHSLTPLSDLALDIWIRMDSDTEGYHMRPTVIYAGNFFAIPLAEIPFQEAGHYLLEIRVFGVSEHKTDFILI